MAIPLGYHFPGAPNPIVLECTLWTVHHIKMKLLYAYLHHEIQLFQLDRQPLDQKSTYTPLAGLYTFVP